MNATEATSARFVLNSDGTVWDKEQNLDWQLEAEDKERTHADAMKYCEENEAGLPGTGWRCPTVKELFGIVDHTRHHPAFDPIFKGPSSYYWSSTPLADDPGGAWYVSFDYGFVSSWGKSYVNYVRAVRQHS